MNHDISTGQKYLPKNHLFQAPIVQLSFISFHLILIKILEKYLLRKSFFRLETCNFTKTEPFAGITVLFLFYRNTCQM